MLSECLGCFCIIDTETEEVVSVFNEINESYIYFCDNHCYELYCEDSEIEEEEGDEDE